MSHRITWRSRPRGDFPINLSQLDVTATDKTLWVGPLTLAQLVEFYFRVKSIRITGALSCTFTMEEDEDPPDVRISSSESYTVDVTLVRTSKRPDPTPPIFTDLVSDEINAFEDNLAEADYFYSFYWGESLTAGEILTHDEGLILKDDSGQFWLKPFFGIEATPSLFAVPAAILNYGTISQSDIGDSDQDYETVNPTLAIGGSAVPFPMVWSAREYLSGWRAIDDVVITSASATVEITEWFPYKTKAGLPAWNTTTGAPANGGPGV